MKTKQPLPIPIVKVLRKLGSDISDARRRRRITLSLMAERAGISRATAARVEKGDPATSISCYAAILFVLGVVDRLGDLVDAVGDATGRGLEDERLPTRVRLPQTGNSHE